MERWLERVHLIIICWPLIQWKADYIPCVHSNKEHGSGDVSFGADDDATKNAAGVFGGRFFGGITDNAAVRLSERISLWTARFDISSNSPFSPGSDNASPANQNSPLNPSSANQNSPLKRSSPNQNSPLVNRSSSVIQNSPSGRSLANQNSNPSPVEANEEAPCNSSSGFSRISSSAAKTHSEEEIPIMSFASKKSNTTFATQTDT